MVRMREAGMRCKDVANCFEVSSSTVSTVFKKWKDTGTCERKKSMTMTRKLTNRDIRLLARYISCDRRQTLGQLGSIFGVHRTTIRRYIRSIGYANRIARKKAFLNATHREKRLAFAHRYKHWYVHEWKHVIWTDESSFEVGKYYRQIRVWRKVNKNFFLHVWHQLSNLVAPRLWFGVPSLAFSRVLWSSCHKGSAHRNIL
jgi:predicted transcriptional regulator